MRDKVIVGRRADLRERAEILGKVHRRKIQILALANNHYAGYGRATAELFRGFWRKQVKDQSDFAGLTQV